MKVASTAGVHEIGFTAPGRVRLNQHAAEGRIPLWLARQQPGAAEMAAQFLAGAVRLRDTIDQLNEMTAGKDEFGVVMAEMVLANRLGAGGTEWVAMAKDFLWHGGREADGGYQYPRWVIEALATSGWSAVQVQPWETISGPGGLFELGTHNPASVGELPVAEGVTVFGVGDDAQETYDRWLEADPVQRRQIEADHTGAARDVGLLTA
jgi:hypothetical protein